MIISHRHKYVFVQLPRTGSTAIGRELRNNYDGQEILHKHSSYYEFQRNATAEEKTYFVFSCIRNPLDDAVSRYFKLKTNHRERYTDQTKLARRRQLVVERIEDRLFNFIQKNDADFATFFKKFYLIPFNDWSCLGRRHYDFVIRFEHIRDDFARALQLMGIEQKRPLPIRNKTGERREDYLSYYTPDTYRRAKRVFGPYMQLWGYDLPSAWGEATIPWWNQLEFEFFTFLRSIYWKHLRTRMYVKARRVKEEQRALKLKHSAAAGTTLSVEPVKDVATEKSE